MGIDRVLLDPVTEALKTIGFIPLQEFERIEWDGPSLVMTKPLAINRLGERPAPTTIPRPDSTDA